MPPPLPDSCKQRLMDRSMYSYCADCNYISQDHITLADYEVHDGMGLELYYN